VIFEYHRVSEYLNILKYRKQNDPIRCVVGLCNIGFAKWKNIGSLNESYEQEFWFCYL